MRELLHNERKSGLQGRIPDEIWRKKQWPKGF